MERLIVHRFFGGTDPVHLRVLHTTASSLPKLALKGVEGSFSAELEEGGGAELKGRSLQQLIRKGGQRFSAGITRIQREKGHTGEEGFSADDDKVVEPGLKGENF